jgi:starch synthase
LSWQKGLDLLLETLPVLLAHDVQLILLGLGDPDLREKFQHAARAHPGEIAVRFDLDETLAHRIQAGADVILIPSRYEPCGLTQLCALHYGAVPVVARVGGLSDTIIDANEMALTSGVATGVQFAPVTTEELTSAIRRTVSLYADEVTWRSIQRNGMVTDVSWRRPARCYAALYRELASVRKTDGKAA